MTRPLVLTGGPAAGRTTCARALALERPRAAYIDVDDVRQLVVSGHVAPWVVPGGPEQRALGARNASALASNFLRAGFEVVLADVLSPATALVYRAQLPGCLVVHLRVSMPEARRRAATRPVHLTADEFERLHETERQDPPAADVVVQVDGMDLASQLDTLRAVWSAAPTGGTAGDL